MALLYEVPPFGVLFVLVEEEPYSRPKAWNTAGACGRGGRVRGLAGVGRGECGALFDARVSEISPGPEGVEVVLIDVDPQELARFNQAYEDHQAAEWAMGDMTP